MAPGDSWTTMRRKSPSPSIKPSSRAPPPMKTLSPLVSPALSSLPKVSLLPPALSASPSGARASPASPENLWGDYPDSHWDVDNDIYSVDLPLPPPSAADFPPLAPSAPNAGPAPRKVAPKLTKAEKATQAKINALLAPVTPAVMPAVKPPVNAAKPLVKRNETPDSRNPSPPRAPAALELPVRKILKRPMARNACGAARAFTGPHPLGLRNDRDCDTCLNDSVVAGSPPPLLSSNTRPATRLYGGAPSVGSTEDDDEDDDNSSASARDDDTIRPVIPPTPPPFPASSADKIDAFAQIRYDESRPTSAAAVREGDLTSHYGFENKAIEDLTWSSTPEPADTIPGYKHSDWPDAILQCDDDDMYHFIKRGHADISKIADDLDALMSGDTSWKTMFHAINDCFQFNTIRGSPEEFMCMMAALAKTWNDDAECRPLDVLTKVINNATALGRVSSRLGTANTALVRIRNERNQARADRKALIDKFLKEQDSFKAAVATTERLRRQRNELKAALEDIRDAPDPLPDALAELQKSSDDVLAENKTLRDTTTTLTDERNNLTEQLANRNEIIAAYERENAELTRQLGDSDILRVGMKGELDTARAVIESMRKSMDAEKATFQKQLAHAAHGVSTAAPSTGDGSAYQQQLESQLAAATKQIAYLDKAYKDKSASLKDALASQATPSTDNRQPKSSNAANSSKSPKVASKGTPKKASKDLPKWGFEPGAEQGSQPYWDHNNKFSEYIAAMVSATVTTLPHIPLSSAIATAIGTVTKAGPPPSKPSAASGKAPSPMKFSGNSSLSSYKTSDGSLSQLTMAQMLASASSADSDTVRLRPTLDGLMKDAQAKPKPTWRALETSKTLVTKPGAKGTRSSELHLRVPRCNATRAMYSANGTRLLNLII
ncbi:hypothetical protein AX14_003976, partial [Amanita brunnescens Koide BX004]